MNTFDRDIEDIVADFQENGAVVQNARWQSVAAPQPSRELLNRSIHLVLPSEDIKFYQDMIKPNLPWGEDAFLERVCGEPLNPGVQWRSWPYARSANLHRREGQEDPQFDHSYAERYWPKFAGCTLGGRLDILPTALGHQGIRFDYGDLNDLVTVLANEATTRQAYLPVFFPEDLGAALLGKRVPCSLGYHFIMRDNQLHVVYYIRSCDFIRHLRDDVYMTIRLLLWVLEQCRKTAPQNGWHKVHPGTFLMHITSLHVFEGDTKFLV